MIKTPWARRAVIAIYVAVAAFVIAHSVNAYVSYSFDFLRNEPAPVSAEVHAVPEREDAKTLARSILTARLFPVPPDADLANAGRPAAPPPPPLDVAKKLLLLGTAVNPQSGGLAILEDLPSKKQVLYHLNETVPTVGTIKQIEKDRVLFRKDSQEEWLNLAIGNLSPGFELKLSTSAPPSSTAPSLPRPALALPVSAPALQAISKGRQSIERRILIDLAQNPSRWYYGARPVESIVNGRPQGVRLETLDHFTFYGQLGFQNNDVITRINGVEVRNHLELPSLAQHLKDERTIQIDILRKDQPKTLAIDVQ